MSDKDVNRYELSSEADQDVSAIYDYTVEKFGVTQAVQYLQDIDDMLMQLVAHPALGVDRPEIRSGVRSKTCHHHVIFYRVLDDCVRVVRVLHESRDVPALFD